MELESIRMGILWVALEKSDDLRHYLELSNTPKFRHVPDKQWTGTEWRVYIPS